LPILAEIVRVCNTKSWITFFDGKICFLLRFFGKSGIMNHSDANGAGKGVLRMTDRALADLAYSMLSQSYCPYSKFPVGAALLCADGAVFTGCNIENAAYGSTICAERTALVKAVSEGHRDDLVKLAVVGNSEDYCWPCGACRQMLWEFAPDLKLLVGKADQSFVEIALSDLLPHGFGAKDLALGQKRPAHRG